MIPSRRQGGANIEAFTATRAGVRERCQAYQVSLPILTLTRADTARGDGQTLLSRWWQDLEPSRSPDGGLSR